MSTSSMVRLSLLRRAPFIPLVPCDGCGVVLKKSTSGTKEHDRWVYYKCNKHARGCNFWYWEKEYVEYLVENYVLTDDAAVDAIGWSEERREELELRKECEATRHGNDEMVIKKLCSISELLTEAVLLLKLAVGLLGVVCVLLLQNK